MHKELFELFQGDTTCYLKSSLTGEDDERGKKGANYVMVKESLTANLWQQHLEGKIRIGVKPEIGDECMWGCIDVDPNSYKDYSEKKYVEIISKYKLPFVPVKSKSGGLHIFVFFTQLAKIDKIKKKLNQINEQYFLSDEVFPMNKAINMPYFNCNATMEYGFDDGNTPIMVGRFIEFANSKKIKPEDFYTFKVADYDAESEWNHYPPCVQKLVQEGWSGNNRNNYLFNIMVLEMKKNQGLTIQQVEEKAFDRNRQVFTKPLGQNEVVNLCKSVHKQGYEFQCPPKHPEFQPICNRELCKTRRLGIGDTIPEVIDKFDNITYIMDTKTIFYEFDYEGKHVMITPSDMKDEKSFRVKLLQYKLFWMTLPKPRKGPSPFELLMKGVVEKSQENKDHLYEDTVEEERYRVLKDFFESHIEQDKFNKLKDGYVVLDSKTNICYFKKITLSNFLKKKANGIFNTPADALRLLECKRKDYHEGEKNIWWVEMPEFVNHHAIKSKATNKKIISEIDDDYHAKFRIGKTEDPAPQDR